MNVICVKWGSKYGWEWVLRLRNMVSRHLTIPHNFFCMSDDRMPDFINDNLLENDGIPYLRGSLRVPCADGLPGWWAKVGLFRPGLFKGLNLYLDLDVVITDSIDALVIENDCHDKVVAPDDFSYSLINKKQNLSPDTRRLLGGDGTVNSSVMLWRDDAGRRVWDEFRMEKMSEVHGDQNWITQCLWPHGELKLLEGDHVCSYKYHVQRGEPVRSIVVFHGEPKVTGLGNGHPLYKAWAA